MSPSIPQLLIVLFIIIVLFGTKRLRTIGADMGHFIRNFRSNINKEED